MKPGRHIDYKALRKINPKAARMAVIEYLSSNGGNVSDAARVFGIQRAVVYYILRKQAEGDLADRSKAPKISPKRSRPEVEDMDMELKNQTRLGPKRLSIYGTGDFPLGALDQILHPNLRGTKREWANKLKSQRT